VRPIAPELFVTADAVLVITHLLRGRLTALAGGHPEAAGVLVSSELPPGKSPVKHVRVRRSGGVMANVVEDAPRLDLQVWQTTDRARADLVRLCRAIVWQATGLTVTGAGLPAGVRVGRVAEFAGPNELPDPRSTADPSSTIIQWTAEIRLRGAAA
jgi:hypothetical protein